MARVPCYLLTGLLVALVPTAARAASDGSSVPGPPSFSLGATIAQALPLASPPAPLTAAAPASQQPFFADHFSGSDLSSAWGVGNRNTDGYIVDNGKLLIIARAAGGFGNDKSQNIFRLDRPMPDGNWTATVTLSAEFQTFRESLFFGLIESPQNFLATQLYASSDCCSQYLTLRIIKVSGGQTSQFDVPVAKANEAAQPLTVRLTKEGYEYRAGINLAGKADAGGKPVWITTGAVTTLRAPRTFALNASQWENTTGESPFHIESVTIAAVAK